MAVKEQEEVQPEASLAQLPPEVNEAVEGLMWLGHLEESFDFCGHSFMIRTLKAEEELMVARLAKEYMDTLGQPKAWAWAHISLAIVAVDGDEDFCPGISPDRYTNAKGRFQYCTTNWYWPLGDYIFQRYLGLLQKQADAIEAVKDLSPRSLPIFTPIADSLTGPEDSAMEDLAAGLPED